MRKKLTVKSQNYFRKKFSRRYLTGFQTRFCKLTKMSICGKKTSAAYNQLDLMKYRTKQKTKGAENVYLKAADILNPVEYL